MFGRRADETAAADTADDTADTDSDGVGEEAASNISPLVDAVRRGQAAGQFADVPPERIVLSCWGILELTGAAQPDLDVAGDYEHALRAMIAGWTV